MHAAEMSVCVGSSMGKPAATCGPGGELFQLSLLGPCNSMALLVGLGVLCASAAAAAPAASWLAWGAKLATAHSLLAKHAVALHSLPAPPLLAPNAPGLS